MCHVLPTFLSGAAKRLWALITGKLEDAIRRVFARKGDAVVEANIRLWLSGRKHRNERNSIKSP